MQAKSELENLGKILSVIPGGQSSFTICRLNLHFIILGEILVGHTGGGQSSLTMCRPNLNLKILGKILVSHTGGSIIFHHVQAKSELENFR